MKRAPGCWLRAASGWFSPGAVVVVVGAVAASRTYAQLADEAVVSNVVLGLSLALAGYPIARLRPGNAVGWLLAAGGLGFMVSAAGRVALDAWARDHSQVLGWRLLADATSLGWPVAVGAALPLTLLTFPYGRRWGSRHRWRPDQEHVLLARSRRPGLPEGSLGRGALVGSARGCDGPRSLRIRDRLSVGALPTQ